MTVRVVFELDVVTPERGSAIQSRIPQALDPNDKPKQIVATMQKVDYRTPEIDGEGVQNRLCFCYLFLPKSHRFPVGEYQVPSTGF